MIVVIFRAIVKQPDENYSKTAVKMRELALTQFSCIEFVSLFENNTEIALSYWNNENDIKAWKQQADHLMAQELGRTQWYESYSVEVAEIKRSYHFPKQE